MSRISFVTLCRFVLLGLSFTCMLPLGAQKQWVRPKPGDGITVLLKRYGRTGHAYYREFVRLNKNRLGKGEDLILGQKYLLPEKREKGNEPMQADKHTRKKKPTQVVEPLFGPSLQYVPIADRLLENACFYIVSGHGGPDPGASGKIGDVELHEDEYAYDIALRLARQLMSHGAEVRIIIQDKTDGIRSGRFLNNSKTETCDGDPIPLNQVARLQQRCDKINRYYRKDKKNFTYCRAFFIHVDSRSQGNQTDVYFYYQQNRKDSKHLAQTMQQVFEQKYGRHQPDRGFAGTISYRNLYVLNHTLPVSAFVELGNIRNPLDQKRLIIEQNREALARWLAEGFIRSLQKS